jgi:hypothetical protein
VGLTIKGGPELRARLQAVIANAPEMERAWADDAAKRIKAAAPSRTGRLKASVRAGTSKGRGAVFGAFWGVFIDRGTKPHTIEAHKAKALRFEYRGQTIFAKKVQRKRMRRRPFITKGAQDALAASPIHDQIIKAWNRKASGRAFRKLTL